MDSVRASIGLALADRYSIERELGSGAMALVFLANDQKHDRWVAIKVLKPEVASAIGAERFHREIDVVAGLTHPHILPLHDSGEASGLFYYVMPFIGESLRDRLAREVRLPIPAATRICREIADALGFAHRHGVTHRDVKPANILLSEEHALLADFGIAHLAETDRGTLTDSGLTLGTPAYFSPEQATGARDIDGRSDIYSLGCVLYESLTGEPPFTDANVRALVMHHLVDAPPRVRKLRPEVSDGIEAVVQTALRKEPEERFQTAEELAASLDLVSGGFEAMAAAALRKLLGPRHRWLHGGRLASLVAAAVLMVATAILLFQELQRPALGVAYPTYALLPVVGDDQTEEEREIALRAHKFLNLHLQGWESVTAINGLMLEGTAAGVVRAGFGIPSRSLVAALEFADRIQASHVIYVDATASGDSIILLANIFAIRSERPERTLTQKGPKADVSLVAAGLALQILKINGEPAELDQLRSRSPHPGAHQQFTEGWTMLLDWRLAEAEAFFRGAIELDPEFALAHYHLALTMYWRTVRDPERILDGEAIQYHVMQADRFGDAQRLRYRERRDLDAFKSFWAGDYASAREQYAAILDREPTRLDALVLAGAVEVEDPWLSADAGGRLLGPRGDWNWAVAAFDSAVGLNRHVQLAWGQLFEIERDLAVTAYSGYCYGFLPPGGSLFPPYEFPEAAEVEFFCPHVEDGSISWQPDTLTDAQLAKAVAEVGVLRERIENRLNSWSGIWEAQARPHEELADRLLWERLARGCDTDAAHAESLLRDARSHTEQALALRGDTTPEDRLRLAVLLLASDELARAETETDRAIEEFGDWRRGQETPPPKLAANVYLALGQGHPTAELLEAVSNQSTWAVSDTLTESGAIPGGPVYGTLWALGALGLTGDDSTGIADRFRAVSLVWTRLGYSEREQAMLRAHTTSIVGPALLRQPQIRSSWFADWDLTDVPLPPVWRGLSMVEERPAEARRHLGAAIAEVESRPAARRRAIHYYLPIRLAERLGDDSTVAELVERAASCPLSLDNIDLGWGMRRYLAGHER